ncbi:hypothetical protein C0J45_20027 [Silurus meridionalis]|nr:hypothetical protein C0J45_20027 [Silurus meridionalis]
MVLEVKKKRFRGVRFREEVGQRKVLGVTSGNRELVMKKSGQEYTEMWQQVKRDVVKAKEKAYEELYEKLDTKEGEKDLYRLARQRDRAGKDVLQVKAIKDGDFFNIIFIVFVMEVIAAVLLLLKRPVAEKILEKISNKVVTSIKETYGQNYIITKAWNEMMNLMQCCGYNNYTDFQGTKFVNQTSLYPNFCCLNEQSLRCDSVKAESVGVNGCFKAVVNWVSSKATFLRGVAICVAAIQVAAMLVSLLLYKS